MLILLVLFYFLQSIYAAICRNKKYLGSHYGLDIGYTQCMGLSLKLTDKSINT